jgi:hypothetical protein
MGFFWSVKCPKCVTYAIYGNPSLPLFAGFTYPLEPTGIIDVFFRIMLIFRVGCLSQIDNAVVCPHTVDMVDTFDRPLVVAESPSNSMGCIAATFVPDNDVTFRSNGASTPRAYLGGRPRNPNKTTGFGVIPKDLAQIIDRMQFTFSHFISLVQSWWSGTPTCFSRRCLAHYGSRWETRQCQ